MVMNKAAEMQTVDRTLIREMPEEKRQAYGLRTPAEKQTDSEGAKHNAPLRNLHNAPLHNSIRDLKKKDDAHDRP